MAEALKVNKRAPLRNVAAFSTLIQTVVERPFGVVGMALFSGDPGRGKTEAAIQGANMYRAVYVECGQFTTARSLLQDILTEFGERKISGTIVDMIRQAVRIMASDMKRPLIVDDAHHIAKKGFVDVLRELHDKSRAPVILIGEETLPRRLQQHPHVKDRLLVEVEAFPCDVVDFGLLAKTYCPGVKLAPELAELIMRKTGGNARRIVVNLAHARQRALAAGPDDTLTIDGFGGEQAVTRNTLLNFVERV